MYYTVFPIIHIKSFLLKQDPVNQMDFKDALDFLRLLRHYAEKYDKIVVTSLAAAPSAFYSVCHNHLFLYSGHVRMTIIKFWK